MIEPDKYYTLYEILNKNLLPGVTTYAQLIAKVKTDAVTNRHLDAVRVPRGGNGVQYQIKGANLITYLVNNE